MENLFISTTFYLTLKLIFRTSCYSIVCNSCHSAFALCSCLRSSFGRRSAPRFRKCYTRRSRVESRTRISSSNGLIRDKVRSWRVSAWIIAWSSISSSYWFIRDKVRSWGSATRVKSRTTVSSSYWLIRDKVWNWWIFSWIESRSSSVVEIKSRTVKAEAGAAGFCLPWLPLCIFLKLNKLNQFWCKF